MLLTPKKSVSRTNSCKNPASGTHISILQRSRRCYPAQNMPVDVYFYDGIFDDGVFTERRIDAACARLMKLAQSDESEAKKARCLLEEMFLLAIADGRVVDPKGCASHYFTVVNAALGEPTLLDKVKEWQEKRKP